MNRIMYAAAFRYGSANLSKITVAKETEKTIVVSENERMMGWLFFGSRTMKDKYELFDELPAALAWLIEATRAYAEHLRLAVKETDEEVAELERALEAARG